MLYIMLLAVSLSMDAGLISFACGLRSTKITLPSKLTIAAISSIFFAAAMYLGKFFMSFLCGETARIIGITLMCAVCLWLSLSMLKKDDEKEVDRYDSDKSNTITVLEAIFLGASLSFDSIGIGFGYALTGSVSIFSALAIGAVSLVFVLAGNEAGLRIGRIDFQHQYKLKAVSVLIMVVLLVIRIIA